MVWLAVGVAACGGDSANRLPSSVGITPGQVEEYRRNAAAMRRGFDAVLLPGGDVRQLDIDDWPTRCAAVLAHAALNRAIKNLDNPHIRSDIRYGLLGRL